METQNPSGSKKKEKPQLEESVMEQIDTELFWLENTLTKMDHARSLMKDKEWFLKSFSDLWDGYTDLIVNNSTTPERAKYIFMKNLRDTLEQKALLQKGMDL